MSATSESDRLQQAPDRSEGTPVATDTPRDTGTDTADRGSASRLVRRVRRIPAYVAWITALHCAVLLVYSVVLPTYRAPDEPLHVDLAHLFSEELTYPAWDDRETATGIQRSLRIVQFGSRSANLEADAAPPKGDRPSIEELEEPPVTTGINQLPQHPPLYYVTTGAAMWTVEAVAGDPLGDFMLETWFYRLISALFVTTLPVVIWRICRLVGSPRSVTVAAMLFPLAIPQYLHIGSSTNNDNLVLMFIWMLTPVVVRVADGALSPRTAALAGALTGLAFLTKIYAMVMPLWILGALVVAVWRADRSNLRTATRFGVIYGLVALVCGGWWWVRNVVLYGRVFPSRFNEIAPPPVDAPRDLWDYVNTWAYATTGRFWGDFGWYDTQLPGVAFGIASGVCVVALAAGCLRRDDVAGTARATRLLLVAPFLVLVSAQFTNSLRAYLDTGRMAGLQGRYWFGAIAGLAVVISLGLANLAGRWRRYLPLAMLGGVVAMQAVAMVAILRFYWGAPGSGLGDRLRAVVAWAPLPGELLAVGAVLGLVVGVVAVAHVVAPVRRPDPDEPGGATPPPARIGAA